MRSGTEQNNGVRRGPAQERLCLVGLMAVLSALLLLAGPASVRADEGAARSVQDRTRDTVGFSHGLSAFGDLKYPPDFEHFDYVNPDAPVGGRLSMVGDKAKVTFDSFNTFTTKGDFAQDLDILLYDTLMARAADEPDAVYGLVASAARVADDKRSVTFRLRPEARFADGAPVRAADLVATLDALKSAQAHPAYRLQLRDVVGARADDALTVTYNFKSEALRDLPLLVASLPILSRAWLEANDLSDAVLEAPLGSGPYRIAKYRTGTYVIFERRADYWGWDLPVNNGRWNFAELRYEYFKDRVAELEGLKSGAFDLREEFTSRDWATAYDVAAVRSGQLVRETLADGRPGGTQGFFINTRRKKFQDLRVRRALGLAFDFEWSNKNLFFGLYNRTVSYFQNSDLMASGEPTEAELAVLEPFRDQLDPAVFEEVFTPPRSNGSGQDRRLLREADRLLRAAGWTSKDGQRVNADGVPLTVEFLLFSPSFERVYAPFVNNLRLLGVQANIVRVDPAQYEERLKEFDFDITGRRYIMKPTPGPELNNMFGSTSVTARGSFNIAGIDDPVVDALLAKAQTATSREELRTIISALDRVLRAGHYWISNWYKAAHNIVYWNRFSRPTQKPRYARGVLDTWWVDEAKATALAAAGGDRSRRLTQE